MSMICSLQAFKDADLDQIRSGCRVAGNPNDSKQTEGSFPLVLYLVEIIAVLFILGHTCKEFPRFWYIWVLLAICLLVYLYVVNKRSESKLDRISGLQSENELWLDKAWHGIHFLLTGSAWEGKEPLNFLVVAGEAIKGTDNGYGEDRAFTSEQVKNIDKELQGISKEEFESRFDSAKMMEEDIYPTIWDRPKEEDDTLGYISEYFVEMKQYINRIAEQNMGMIVVLS